MGSFQAALSLAAFLCSLVAGFLFAFAFVVMPGIGRLRDGDFLRAFQAIDRIIQNNQPLFMLVWVGSVVSLAAAAALGLRQLDGIGLLLMSSAGVAYIFGVQLPTITINIPLNNNLQFLDVDDLSDAALEAARKEFEPPWNRWNMIRTALSSLTSALLIILLLRI